MKMISFIMSKYQKLASFFFWWETAKQKIVFVKNQNVFVIAL